MPNEVFYMNPDGTPWTGEGAGSGKWLKGVDNPPQAEPWSRGLGDINKDVTLYDEQFLREVCRRMYGSNGLVRALVDDPATFATANGWPVRYTGTDAAWGEIVTKELTKNWFPNAGLKGDDWSTLIEQMLVNVGHSGEVGVHCVAIDGYPQVDLHPSNRIGMRGLVDDVVLSDGPYAGYRCRRGVVLDRHGREVAFHLLGDTEADDRFVSAAEMVLLKEKLFTEQIKGWPSLTASVKELRSVMTSQDLNELAVAIASAYAVSVENEKGSDEVEKLNTEFSEDGEPQVPDIPPTPALSHKRLGGGLINYFKAGTNSKISQVAIERPGDIWDKFADRLGWIAGAGVGWPYELIRPPAGLNTATIKVLENRARNYILDRQSLIRKAAKRIVLHAVVHLMELGVIPKSADWWSWEFVMPPQFSINPSKDIKSQMEQYRLGAVNMTQMLAEQGLGRPYEHSTERAWEIIDKERARRDVLKKANELYGSQYEEPFEIDPRDMGTVGINDQPTKPEDEQSEKENDNETNK